MEKRSLADARALLGADGEHLTDAEVLEFSDAAYAAAEMLVQLARGARRAAGVPQLQAAIYPRRPRRPRSVTRSA